MSKVCPNSFAVAYNNKAYVFKSETMLRSQLVRPKDAVDPAKQDGVVYRIPCKCGKVYIGETGRPMQDRIKEHDRDIRLALTETSRQDKTRQDKTTLFYQGSPVSCKAGILRGPGFNKNYI